MLEAPLLSAPSQRELATLRARQLAAGLCGYNTEKMLDVWNKRARERRDRDRDGDDIITIIIIIIIIIIIATGTGRTL